MTSQNDQIVEDKDETFTESVAAFIESASYLTAEHRPAVKVLRALARAADAEIEAGKAPQAALIAQFSQNYRYLAKLNPAAASSSDETLPPPLWE